MMQQAKASDSLQAQWTTLKRTIQFHSATYAELMNNATTLLSLKQIRHGILQALHPDKMSQFQSQADYNQAYDEATRLVSVMLSHYKVCFGKISAIVDRRTASTTTPGTEATKDIAIEPIFEDVLWNVDCSMDMVTERFCEFLSRLTHDGCGMTVRAAKLSNSLFDARTTLKNHVIWLPKYECALVQEASDTELSEQGLCVISLVAVSVSWPRAEEPLLSGGYWYPQAVTCPLDERESPSVVQSFIVNAESLMDIEQPLLMILRADSKKQQHKHGPETIFEAMTTLCNDPRKPSTDAKVSIPHWNRTFPITSKCCRPWLLFSSVVRYLVVDDGAKILWSFMLHGLHLECVMAQRARLDKVNGGDAVPYDVQSRRSTLAVLSDWFIVNGLRPTETLTLTDFATAAQNNSRCDSHCAIEFSTEKVLQIFEECNELLKSIVTQTSRMVQPSTIDFETVRKVCVELTANGGSVDYVSSQDPLTSKKPPTAAATTTTTTANPFLQSRFGNALDDPPQQQFTFQSSFSPFADASSTLYSAPLAAQIPEQEVYPPPSSVSSRPLDVRSLSFSSWSSRKSLDTLFVIEWHCARLADKMLRMEEKDPTVDDWLIDGLGYESLAARLREYEACVAMTSSIPKTSTWWLPEQIATRHRLVATTLVLAIEEILFRTSLTSVSKAAFTFLPIPLLLTFLREVATDLDPAVHAWSRNLLHLCYLRRSASYFWTDPLHICRLIANDPICAFIRNEFSRIRQSCLTSVDAALANAATLLSERTTLSADLDECDCLTIVDEDDHPQLTNMTLKSRKQKKQQQQPQRCVECRTAQCRIDVINSQQFYPTNFPFSSLEVAVLYWLPQAFQKIVYESKALITLMCSGVLTAVPQHCIFNGVPTSRYLDVLGTCGLPKFAHGGSIFCVVQPGPLRIPIALYGRSALNKSDIYREAHPTVSTFLSGGYFSTLNLKPLTPTVEGELSWVVAPPSSKATLSSTRGNMAYTSRPASSAKQSLERSLIAIRNIRAFPLTQHRHLLQAMLNRHLTGALLHASSPVEFLTALSTAGHAHGYGEHDHYQSAMDLVDAACTFVGSVSASNSAVLVLLSCIYGAAASVGGKRKAFVVIRRAMAQAAHLAADMQIQIDSNGSPSLWDVVEGRHAITMSCAAFLSSDFATAACAEDVSEVAAHFLKSLFRMSKASVLATKASGSISIKQELNWCIFAARHRAVDWLPSVTPATLHGILTEVVTALDATILPQDIKESSWKRNESYLLVFEGEFTLFSTSKTKTVFLDVMSGDVYLDNAPIIGLPLRLRESAAFKLLFEPNMNFHVTPLMSSSSDTVVVGGYRTVANVAKMVHETINTERRTLVARFHYHGDISFEDRFYGPCDGGAQIDERIIATLKCADIPSFSANFLGGCPHMSWHTTFHGHQYMLHYETRHDGPSLSTMSKLTYISCIDSNEGKRKVLKVPADMQTASPVELLLLMEANKLSNTFILPTVPGSLVTLFRPLEPIPSRIVVSLVNGALHVVLCRFNLTFLFDKVHLRSLDKHSYIFDETNQYVPWLPMSRNHLVLRKMTSLGGDVTDPDMIVLLPMGNILDKGAIALPELCPVTGGAPSCRWLEVCRHAHFGYLETRTMTQRLFIAALLIIGDPMGGVLSKHHPADLQGHEELLPVHEEALILLRRCISNERWTGEQRKLLQMIVKKDWHPSLTLIVGAMQAAESMFPREGDEGETRAKSQLIDDCALSLAVGRYERLLREGRLSDRCRLRPEELHLLFSVHRGSHAVRGLLQRLDGSVLCSTPQLQARQVRVVGLKKQALRAASEWETAVSKVLAEYIPTCTPAAESEIPPFPVCLDNDDCAPSLQTLLCNNATKSWTNSFFVVGHLDFGALRPAVDTIALDLDKHITDVRAEIAKFERVTSIEVSGGDHADGVSLARCLEMSQRLPRFHLVDAGRVLVQGDAVPFLSALDKQSKTHLQKSCLLYTKLCILKDRVARLVQMVSQTTLNDVVTLESPIVRELSSPRESIANVPSWLVLEAEQRISIRRVQYDTWKFLNDSVTKQMSDSVPDLARKKCVTQLNMGEGKTRIIVPMIILSQLASAGSRRSCVHALSTVISQYKDVYRNVLCTPGLGVSLLSFPFHRSVPCTSAQHIARLTRLFIDSALRFSLLVAREHYVSFVVKQEEILREKTQQQLTSPATAASSSSSSSSTAPSSIQKEVFGTLVHIFDEVDELLRHDFGLVYAIGRQQTLPVIFLRGEVFSHALRCVAVVVSRWLPTDRQCLFSLLGSHERDEEEAQRVGRFPPVYFVETQPELLKEFMDEVISELVVEPPHTLAWLKNVVDIRLLLEAPSPPAMPFLQVEDRLEQLMLLRGLFYHKILYFVMSRKPQVHYGVPKAWRADTDVLAVPYEAADLPTKRSVFAQPDVEVLLTFLAYFHHGLTLSQWREVLIMLSGLPVGLRERELRVWRSQGGEAPCADLTEDMDLENHVFVKRLFDTLGHSTFVVSFWLRLCVLPRYCRQFPLMLMGSSWDIADVDTAVGFSGTSDGCALLPERIDFHEHPDVDISTAGGKMMQKVIANKNCCISILTSSSALRIVEQARAARCDVIIDAAGLLAGVQLKDFAITALEHISRSALEGVCFFDGQSDEWVILDKATRTLLPHRLCSIDVSKCLVVYDQARCRGHDLKLASNCVAFLTVGPGMTRDFFMQSVGRLRKFGCSQTIVAALTPGVADSFTSTGRGLIPTVPALLQWLFHNTLRYLSSGLHAFAQSAVHFSRKVVARRVGNGYVEIPLKTLPSHMYSPCITTQLLTTTLESLVQTHPQLATSPLCSHSLTHVRTLSVGYRHTTSVLSGDTLEREVCKEVEVQEEVEREIAKATPVEEPLNSKLMAVLNSGEWDDSVCAATLQHPIGIRVPESCSCTHNFALVISAAQMLCGQFNSGIQQNYFGGGMAAVISAFHAAKAQVLGETLRQVDVLLLHVATKRAVLLSHRESNDVLDHCHNVVNTLIHFIALGPRWGGFSVLVCGSKEHAENVKSMLNNEHPDPSCWIISALVFCMMFNGCCSFPPQIRLTVQAMFVKGPDALKSARWYVEQRRCLDNEFPGSDLEHIARCVVDSTLLTATKTNEDDEAKK